MLYRKMPKVKEELSILGFGCMRLPVQENGKIDEPRAIAQIRHAIDNGVNYLDTAWPYHGGDSERLVGEALKDGYRQKAFAATKLPSWMVKSRSRMDEFIEQQCQNLGTDPIDFYLIHNLAGPMWERLKSMDVLDFIDQAKKSGRIRYAGFSFHGRIDDFKTIVDDYYWDFCQIQYNYLDEYHQAGTEGLKYAAGKGLVKQAADTYRRLMVVNCTGCEYCKPCPEGVNISGAFEILNKLHLFKNEPEARFMYAIRCGDIFSGGQMGYASRCIQCGECLDKCPQGIPIPDMLEQVVADLEDDKTLERLAMGKKMLNM
jgi:predicted aldo/keto reductase-like oxidoreductase